MTPETSGVVARPLTEAPPSWVCNRCDHILHDGIHYELCPRCGLRVDWVDLRFQVWACPTCFRMLNADRPRPPGCVACQVPMRLVSAHESPLTGRSRLAGFFEVMGPVAIILCGLAAVLPALSMALDPRWRWFALGTMPLLVLLPVVFAVLFLADAATGFDELKELLRDRRTRVIHGIEHATSHLFELEGVRVNGGRTGSGYFEVSFPDDVPAPEAEREQLVSRTSASAVQRLEAGQVSLAYHSRCGSSWIVAMVLTALAIAGMGAVGLFGHFSPGVLGGLSLAVLAVIVALARPLGLLLQKHVTVSTRFSSARAGAVTRRVDDHGTHYRVRVEVELQAS